MEENYKRVSFQRLSSEDSTYSEDSCEYYQCDIYGKLPSSLSRWKYQYRDQDEAEVEEEDDDDDDDFEYVSPLLYRDWDSTQPLKTLPLCMQEKRNLRERRHQERLNISPWMTWKQSQQTMWRRLKEQVESFLSGLLLWKHTLHKIEGGFGVGVKAYFVFLRYLLCLNLLNCVIITGYVLIPLIYGRNDNQDTNWDLKIRQNDSVLDIFLGSGYLERSPIFYGFYKHKLLDLKCLNTSLLFFAGMVSIFFLSLIMIVRRTVVGYKHKWLMGSRFSGNMSYKVFCGWDFCIQDPQAALLKHSFNRNELKMDLEEQKFRLKVSQRTLKQKVVLYLLRFALNILVLLLLGGSFVLIYYATIKSQHENLNLHWTLKLLWEYLPPITITLVNFLLPHAFSIISVFEDYYLTTQLNLTLVRSIFLKLASLGIYLFFIIKNDGTTTGKCKETEFGKEMYKLTVFHLLACCLACLLACSRMLIVEKFPSRKLAKIVGKPEFVIPLNVLDLVYSQTVTWVGVFYCPLLPAISILKLLAVFYVKKFTVVQCCVPAQRMFRTTSSSVLFNFMLLLGLIMSAVTLGINIIKFVPGNCGPFMGNSTVFNVTSACVRTLPGPAQTAIQYMTSEAFAFALILAEVIILTSFISRGRANLKVIERLKDMLVMCSSDKRFLVKEHFTLVRRLKKNNQCSEELTSPMK
ncbi:transmembrane channel-like protein 7 [Hoplias malabaricus]|uniref:transmembrane channel-like protein 7 n=1 Tax=Hoplias malabaricus TaxID=27720 RepID=UPI003461E618